MLSASPAAVPGLERGPAAARAVEAAVSREERPAHAVTSQVRRSAVAASPWARVKLDQQYVRALRARDPKAWRAMLATVRERDRPAWRAIQRAVQAGQPRAASVILAAVRSHFPAMQGVPPRAPGEVAAPTSASAPSLALPLGPQFDLGTRWDVIQAENTSSSLNPPLVAMSPDSTVWGVFASNPQALYQYDPIGQAWYDVWEAPGWIVSMSAGPSDATGGRTVVVVYSADKVASAIVLQGGPRYGEYLSAGSPVPIPGGPLTAQVVTTQVAGANQPFWALADGTVWKWTGTPSQPRWVSVPTGGLSVEQIAVVGADTLWAVVSFPGTSNPSQAYQRVNGKWQAGPTLSAGVTDLAGTGDGTLWARDGNGNLYTLSTDGSIWVAVTSLSAAVNQNPTTTAVATPATYTALAAGSKYRAAAANPNSGVQLLTYGLADQPATGFPAMDAGEQAGYAYINQYLGITAPGGIRSMYQQSSDTDTLAGYEGTLLTLSKEAVPSGLNISLDDWKAITKEVHNEVLSVVAVYNYFQLIDSLTTELSSEVPTLLSNTSQQIQLSKDQQNSLFGVILDQIFSAALGGIVKAFSGAAGVAASLIASGISDAIADATRNQSSETYTLNYYELSSMIYSIFTGANATNSALKVAILADPNRFLPFGVGVTSGTLSWPAGTKEQIAGATLNAFQAYFFQVLTPLAWPIYYATGFPADEMDCWPSDASYFQPDSAGSRNGTVYLLGTPGAFGFNFPDSKLKLVQTILSVTGATQAQLLTNQVGWWPKMVERSAEFMLMMCAGPPPLPASGPAMT